MSPTKIEPEVDLGFRVVWPGRPELPEYLRPGWKPSQPSDTRAGRILLSLQRAARMLGRS